MGLFRALFILSLGLICSAEIFTHKGARVEKFHVSQPAMVDSKRNIISKKIDTRVPTYARSEHGHFLHRRNVDIMVNVFGNDYVLNLSLNEDLLAPNYHVIYGSPDGSSYNISYGAEHCYYKGSIEGVSSLLALSTCGQRMEGMMKIDGVTYIIAPKESNGRQDRSEDEVDDQEISHIVYNDDDILEKLPFSCGVPEGDDHQYNKRHELEKEFEHVHSHENSNVEKRAPNRYVEFLAVNDYRRVQDFTLAKVGDDTINLINAVTQLYQSGSFPNAEGNIVVRLIGQYIPSSEEWVAGSSAPDANTLLDEFCDWRTARLGKSTDALGVNDNAELLSGRDFTSSGSTGVAGLAWVGTMCSSSNSCGVSEARIGRSISSTSTIVTHEMGHNFNSPHDSSGNSCPQSGFIMAAVSCSNCNTWSSCSQNTINTFLPRATCLTNVPTIQYPDNNPCGNYVVDAGEDCDSGPSGSTCCNGRTSSASTSCKWKAGAVCDNNNPCCSNCQRRPTTYLCRASSTPCDLDDYCSTDGVCGDAKRSDGSDCGTAGKCSAGNCLSRDSQCSSLNGYIFTVGGSQVKGPFTPCNTGVCILNCQGTGSTTCISLQNYNLPNEQRFVSQGLPCTCTNGLPGTCPGNSGTCGNCGSAPTSAPTSGPSSAPTQAPTQTPTQAPTLAPTTAPCNRATCNDHGTCFAGFCFCDPGWGGPTCNLIPGCDGVAGSGKVVDECGVCGGKGASCAGCDGIPNSGKIYDRCGVCGGNNACVGCDGVVNSGKTFDRCGVCGGNGMSCVGCDGIVNSTKTFDVCGVCGGNGQSCRGCDGVPNSGKILDACGICDGDGSTCVGCDGVPNSGKIVDLCGVCGGSNACQCTGSGCLGCDGVPNSGKIYDLCGVCGGSNTACAGCDGVPNSKKVFDACGVCGGNNSTCRGCDGKINSGKTFDVCGVCDGNGQSCRGCDGVPNSGKILDVCGVCGGNGATCAGCDGVPNSGKGFDRCGVCGGNNACVGCDGVVNSGKVFDFCGICGGDGSSCPGEGEGCTAQGKQVDQCGVCGGDGTSCVGCDGVPNSGVKRDACNICGGNNSTCIGCDGVFFSGKKYDSCGVCGGNSDSCRGCDGIIGSGKKLDQCGVCGGDGFTCSGCDGIPNSGKRYDVCGQCGGDGSVCGGFERIFAPRIDIVAIEEGTTYNITASRLTAGTLVYYTVDGTAPNVISSTRYGKSFILDVTQFISAPTSTPSGKSLKRDEVDAENQFTEIPVIVQFQAFPGPNSVRLYQSVISRTTIVFKKKADDGLIGDGGVTKIGAGVIAGAVIGGILALGLLIGLIAYFIVARKAKKEEEEGRKKYKVLYDYQAQNKDEIDLKMNDVITLKDQFGDGWARGVNERTRKEGMFPMSYVSEVESSRLVLMMRPATIYSRISRAFGRGGDDVPTSKVPPKPTTLPPKPNAPSPYYAQHASSSNPTFSP